MRYGRKALKILVKIILTIFVIASIFMLPWTAVTSGETLAWIWGE
jgi:hypothetical protein